MAVFFGGVPTQPDVELLMKEVPVQSGTEVQYAEIERLLGLQRKQSRFRTVTDAWRRRLRREKLLQSTAEGGAIRFLVADQAHDKGLKTLWRIGKSSRRLKNDVEDIDTTSLTGSRVERHPLLRRITHEFASFSRKTTKEIAAPRPISSTVRTAPPSEA